MSVNITKHGSPKKCRRNTTILLDSELTKKEVFDERRKQRLLQVRSQSKELAAQVRQNVNLENKKQLQRIAQVKEQELKNSKRKQQEKNDNMRIFEFGEAHRAANLENKLSTTPIKRPSCPITHNRNYQPTNSLINNKSFKNVDKENSSYNANTQQNKHIYPNVLIENRKSKKVQTEEDSNYSESPRKIQDVLKHSLKNKHSAIAGCCFLPICCCCHPILACQCHLNTNCKCSKKNDGKHRSNSEEEEDDNEKYETAQTASTDTSSNETKPVSSYASFKEKQQQRQNAKKLIKSKTANTRKLTKTPSVIMEVSSEDSDSSSASSCVVEDTHSKDNMHFSRVYSRTGSKNDKTSFKYNAKDFQASTDPSSESLDIVMPPKSTLNKSPIQGRRNKPTLPKYAKKISPSRTKPTSTANSNHPPRVRFTKISDLLKQKTIEQNISTALPISFDKSTQMSPCKGLPDIPEDYIAKDFCTRGVLVDSNELAKNKNNINKVNTESRNSLDNSRFQEAQKQNKEKPKSPRKITKNVNIGQKKRDCPTQGELLGPKSILGGSKTLPKQTLTEKVHYYDYNNRFQKQYHPKFKNLIQHDRNISQLNAMENANIEKQLQKTKDNELDLLRKKSEERCQEAIEREQVRRDYEALQAKLDALSMDHKTNRNICQPTDDNIFSDIRLKQLATVRQNKINNAVENILQHPIVITCPEVNQNLPSSSSNRQNEIKSYEQNYENGINLGNNFNTDNILNSSDSCGSILLNYVDKRTEEICNDIKISNNDEKNCKLKSLLKRLNSLKSDLINELQSNQNNNQNSAVENAYGAINEMNKEHKKIMTSTREKINLEKREKRLKKQEAILEKKLKEFYEMQKSLKKSSHNSESTDSVEGKKNTSTEESTESSISLETKTISTKIAKQPIEILIQVTDKTKKNIKSPCRTPRQKASLIDPMMKRKKKLYTQKISTPVRLDNDEIKNTEQQNENNSQTTMSTAYRSLPKFVENNLNILLNKHHKQQEEIQNIREEKEFQKERQKKISPTKRIATPKKITKLVKKSATTISKISDKSVRLKPCIKEVISQPPPSSVKQVEKEINPILGHYIQRLLGMSRQSINMLGVSSSTVTTPNSSLINNSGNKSDVIDSNFEKERIERLQRFIDDNYSFLSELEESLKTSRSPSAINSSDASQKAVAEIWQKTLKHKSKENIEKEDDCVKKPKKPILKQPSEKLKAIKTSTQNDSARLEVLGKYTELTATCAQRIAELNEMINRVRQEKQKILEITLSSNSTNSENGKNSTEYLEFADKQKQQQSQSTGGRTYIANAGPDNSSKITQISNNENLEDDAAEIDKISEINHSPNPQIIVRVPEIDISENAQLEKNKLTGISRDSGISLSRPVTALGSRDSPDTRRDSKTEDTVIFEPLLKDIPKPNSTNLLPCKSHLTTANSDKWNKKPNKPPVALTRFSPQLIEEIPHELSTIIEIDTPGTSRLNAHTRHLSTGDNIEIPEENEEELLLPSNDKECEALLDDIEIDFKKFPTFEEYANKHNLDLTNFDSELNIHMQNEYKKLLELTQSIKEIQYNDFQSSQDYKNARNELKELISLSDICDDPNNEIQFINSEETLKKLQPKFNNFPTAKEYFKKVGAKDFINSFSLDNVSISTNDIKTFTDDKLTSPCESLPDVNAELKRRNVMQHSFINQYQKSEDNDGTSDDLNSISSNSKDNKKQKNNSDKYPMSGLEQFPSTTTTTGKTEEIEKDLENMGMKWAQVMLQKTQRSQALSSSTASSFLFEKHLRPSQFRKSIIEDFADGRKLKSSTRLDIERDINDKSDSSAVTEYGGKPLNLREFLSQELQKRTNSSTSSSSVSDDSMVNLFLRSLLGSVTPSYKQATDRKQKTSTPNCTLSKSQSTSTKNNSKSSQGTTNNSMKLFSGESRLSSVRFSRSDCEKSVDNNNFKKSNNKQNDENHDKNNKFKNKSS